MWSYGVLEHEVRDDISSISGTPMLHGNELVLPPSASPWTVRDITPLTECSITTGNYGSLAAINGVHGGWQP